MHVNLNTSAFFGFFRPNWHFLAIFWQEKQFSAISGQEKTIFLDFRSISCPEISTRKSRENCFFSDQKSQKMFFPARFPARNSLKIAFSCTEIAGNCHFGFRA